MRDKDQVTLRETGPGVAQVTVWRTNGERVYGDTSRTGHDGRWWRCQKAGGVEYLGRSRKAAVRLWLTSVGVDPDAAQITTLRSY